MESSILSVAQGFNLRCTKSKIYKDKFGHVCATAQGPVRLQRAGGGAQAVIFQHEIKEHLHKNGFAVDRFIISSQGAPYLRIDNDIYTACNLRTDPNIDFTDGPAFLDFVRHMAKIHNSLFEASLTRAPVTPKTGADAAKLLDNLTILRKKLLRAGKFSDFDMLFLRGYEKFAPFIVAFDDAVNGAALKHICHNLLKEENIFVTGGQIAVTNFSEAAQKHHLHDLAYITKRRVKAKPKENMPIGKILETYGSVPGSTPDEVLFRRILLYPDKFIKVTMDYYSKKRSFAPNTYLSRMQECLRAGAVLSESL